MFLCMLLHEYLNNIGFVCHLLNDISEKSSVCFLCVDLSIEDVDEMLEDSIFDKSIVVQPILYHSEYYYQRVTQKDYYISLCLYDNQREMKIIYINKLQIEQYNILVLIQSTQIDMFPTRKAISYVSNRQKLQEYSCSICYNISLDIFQCQGPCQKYYCISCLDKIPSNRRRCNYCSTDSPFQWKQVIVDNLEFICPYTLTKHAKIGSISQFQQHCHTCPQMKSEELQVAQYTQNYQCHEGHDLIFMSESISRKIFKGRSFFTALTNSPCEICKQSTLCRSYCPKCSEQRKKQVLYCTKCRFVPATRTCCPIGHNLQQRNYRSVSSVCDFCGFGDHFSHKSPFSDTTCNFDICYRCYKKLPNQNKLQPLKNEFVPFEDNIVVQPTNTNVLDWRMRFDHHQQQE